MEKNTYLYIINIYSIYLNHFAEQKKLTKQCKSNILQFKKKKKRNAYVACHPQNDLFITPSFSPSSFS